MPVRNTKARVLGKIYTIMGVPPQRSARNSNSDEVLFALSAITAPSSPSIPLARGRPTPSMVSRSVVTSPIWGLRGIGRGHLTAPSPNTSTPWNYLILVPRMGMLAHVPNIDDDIVMSRQGLNYVTYAT